jgi:hypothetical protein
MSEVFETETKKNQNYFGTLKNVFTFVERNFLTFNF